MTAGLHQRAADPQAAPDAPPFAEPWQAQLFALTVELHGQGLFAWPEWSAALGDALAAAGAGRSLDGGPDFWAAWLATLESLLDRHGVAGAAEIGALTRAWEEAYLRTPHGQPVRLSPAD